MSEKLDKEIQKRREKVERWREQQKKLQEKKTEAQETMTQVPPEDKPSSSWTLEGEDDDEDGEDMENGAEVESNGGTPADITNEANGERYVSYILDNIFALF